MNDRLLALPRVEEIVGIKRTKIRQLMANGDFPKACKIGKSELWQESEIQEWIEKQGAS